MLEDMQASAPVDASLDPNTARVTVQMAPIMAIYSRLFSTAMRRVDYDIAGQELLEVIWAVFSQCNVAHPDPGFSDTLRRENTWAESLLLAAKLRLIRVESIEVPNLDDDIVSRLRTGAISAELELESVSVELCRR
jgi:hypothetical protein